MKIIPVAGGAFLLIATLAACGHGAPSPKPTGPTPTGPAATSTATGGSPTARATTTDPCQLVTAREASSLTGASYGAGTLRTVAIGKTCVYGSRTKNVFMVDLFQGSASQLQQVGSHVNEQLQAAGSTAQVNPIPVAGLGAGATAYQVSSEVFNGSSIFAIKGGYALYLVDEVTGGPAAPSTAALIAAAHTALDRLP